MIDKQTIEERKKTITNDILTVKERLSEYEKKKVEDVALINALTGALQQCDYFLKEVDDVEPDLVSDSDSDVENSPEED
jgi:prephenate dehydratase|tara:strand:+ start:110 stop:346 length:237 start_codon:yes stop_codon:yes gene_type:complete